MNPSNVSEPQGGGSAATTLKETARETTGQLKDMASNAAARTREEASRMAEEKKSSTADRLNSYSDAIHESARSLEEKDPNLAYFAHRAADRLHGAADYVRQRDFGELRRDAEDVARRHPLVFFGGLFAAGLLVGNLLKASRRREDGDSNFEAREDDSTASPSGMMPQTAAGSVL
jgi:hypothetical protein